MGTTSIFWPIASWNFATDHINFVLLLSCRCSCILTIQLNDCSGFSEWYILIFKEFFCSWSSLIFKLQLKNKVIFVYSRYANCWIAFTLHLLTHTPIKRKTNSLWKGTILSPIKAIFLFLLSYLIVAFIVVHNCSMWSSCLQRGLLIQKIKGTDGYVKKKKKIIF